MKTKPVRRTVELALLLAAAFYFFWTRLGFLPYWWADFSADFALVGVMANHTLHGHFPIFFYGQNYMGGLEWLTAALAAKFGGWPSVTIEVLRINSLAWWFLAGAAWTLFLRRLSASLGLAFAVVFACGNLPLLQISMLQELSPEYVFCGALVSFYLWRTRTLEGAAGFWFGALLGFAWWTNQSVVFFLLPALWVFQAEPGGWAKLSFWREYVRPERRLRALYGIAAVVAGLALVIALRGGFYVSIGSGHLKIPNGFRTVKDTLLVLALVQFVAKLRRRDLPEWRADARALAKKAAPFAVGFALGYAPVWLGRLFHWYPPNYGLGLGILPLRDWGTQAVSLLRSLDALLLAGGLARAFGSAAPAITLVLGIALLGVAYLRRHDALVRFLAGVILLNVVYVYFSDRSAGAPVRYLYPALLGTWILVLRCALSLRPRALASALALAFMASAVFGGWRDADRLRDYYAASAWRRDNLLAIVQELERRKVSACWGDYWSAYLLTYLTEERITFSPHPSAPDHQVRLPENDRVLREQNPACFVYRHGRETTAPLSLSSENPWEKTP